MSGSRAGRHERFFSKLIAVLSVSAALLVVALVLQSRLTARRNAQVAQQQTLNPSETVAPLIVRAATPEPDPNATQTPVATPAPAAERVEYDFLPIYTGIETDERVIAITLEDMTDVAQFQAAVQIAMSFDAKLTLFPYGKAVQDNNMGAMLKYCVESLNYEIENRTWNDGLLYKMSDSDMANEIFLGDNMIDRALGMNYEMRFFRMHGGYGTNDVRTHAYLRALGYQGVVNWTLDAAVCSNDRLRNTLAPGNIYLFHTTAEDNVKLRNLLAYAQEHEYRFVTVSTLLGLDANAYAPADAQSLVQAAPAPESTQNIYIETRSGDRTWQVYLIQRQLAALGYLDATPDGIFGDSTGSAIRKFQAEHGIVTSGIATTETQQALFSEQSVANGI